MTEQQLDPARLLRWRGVPRAYGRLWRIVNGELIVDFHPGQTAAWDSEAEIVAVIAGSQSGKTAAGPVWLLREIGTRGPGDYMAVSPNFRLQSLKMEPELVRLFGKALRLGVWHRGGHYFELDAERAAKHFDNPEFLQEPTRILFGSAQNPESLESATAKAVWMDEVGQRQFRLEAWEAIQRRVAMHTGRQLLTTTPYAMNWLKQQVYDKWVGGDPRFQVIQFASSANPAFPMSAMRAAKASLPRWRYLLFYLGRFTKPAGLIYDDYNDDYREHGGHVVHPFEIPSRWPRYVGVDFGGANTALVWLAHDIDADVYYAYRESLSGNKSTTQHAAEFWANAGGENMVGICGGAPSETQQRMDWSDAGVPVEAPAFADVEAGIDRVTALLKRKRLFVFDDLRGLRSELGSYSRKLDRFSGEPTDQIEDKHKFHRCMVGGTLVTTDRGSVPIESVVAGDTVLTRRGYRPVQAAGLTARDVPTVQVTMSNGALLRGTPEHPVWATGKRWRRMDALRAGDAVLSAQDGGIAALPALVVVKLEPAPNADVYNLTIEGAHEYFANGVLVHNCDALRYAAVYLDEMAGGSGLGILAVGSARSGWYPR